MIERLIQQLHHPAAHMRSEAAFELGKIASSEVAAVLVDALFAEEDLNVQEDITWALSRLGEVVLPHLIAGLEHESADIRHKLAHTLGKLGNKKAIPALIQLLTDDDPRIRYKSTVALGQIGDIAVVPSLIEALADKNQDVSTGALASLAFWGDEILPQLIEALQHNSDQTCEAVASLLGDLGDIQAVEPLIEALPAAQLAGQLAIIHALGLLGDKRAIPALEVCLNTDHPHIKIAAKYAMKNIGKEI